jgi:hypothetical protein
MSEKDNGGPAFPITAGQQVYAQGMTLRDWFAGQAMAGMLADPNVKGHGIFEIVARDAYKTADAMLAERAK